MIINSYRKTEKRNSDIFLSTNHITNYLLIICSQQFCHLQSSDMIKRKKKGEIEGREM